MLCSPDVLLRLGLVSTLLGVLDNLIIYRILTLSAYRLVLNITHSFHSRTTRISADTTPDRRLQPDQKK